MSQLMSKPPLHAHGIQTEASHVRAHVGVIARSVFVFLTKHGRAACEASDIRDAVAYQPGVAYPTARGKPVPLDRIRDLRRIDLSVWPVWDQFNKDASTSVKGRMAVEVVLHLLRRGGFPFWVQSVAETRDTDIQISGTDIVCINRTLIQVKCDWTAGPRSIPGCSGNLFLQTAELNPLRLH